MVIELKVAICGAPVMFVGVMIFAVYNSSKVNVLGVNGVN